MEEKIKELLTRGVEETIDGEHLNKKLHSGQKLNVKLGIDPTSPNIHIGRSIPLLKLKDFQELGHKIIFIIGDFTGVIGDTSDKDSERPMISEDKIKENLETYVAQVGKILDLDKCEIRYNSEWLDKLGYRELGKQANIFSLHDFNARENIKKRLEDGKRVSMREAFYPMMQGYDSVAVKADVEIGGTDQRFNLLAGRKLQEMYGQEPQDIITNPLIEGLDGRKMSSSWGNTINLTDSPNDMFGKVMTLRDELIEKYFILTTRVSKEKIEKFKNFGPKEFKIELAKEIVRMYHGEGAAAKAEENFDSTFSKGEFPENTEVVGGGKGDKLSDLLTLKKIVESKSEWRRLVEAGAVSDQTNLPDKKITDPNELVGETERKIKIGKKTFVIVNPE